MSNSVLPDANCLYSRTIRDWLLVLKMEDNLYTLHSTEDILAEFVARLRDGNPHVSGPAISNVLWNIRGLLDSTINDCQPRDCAIPDKGDHHIHLAVTDGQINYLITLS